MPIFFSLIIRYFLTYNHFLSPTFFKIRAKHHFHMIHYSIILITIPMKESEPRASEYSYNQLNSINYDLSSDQLTLFGLNPGAAAAAAARARPGSLLTCNNV